MLALMSSLQSSLQNWFLKIQHNHPQFLNSSLYLELEPVLKDLWKWLKWAANISGTVKFYS